MSKKTKDNKSSSMVLLTSFSLILSTSPMTFASGKTDGAPISDGDFQFSDSTNPDPNANMSPTLGSEGSEGNVIYEDRPTEVVAEENEVEQVEEVETVVNETTHNNQSMSSTHPMNEGRVPAATLSGIQKWSSQSSAPAWYNESKNNIGNLQGNVEGRKVFRGTSSYIQCTDYAALPWDELVSPSEIKSTKKWQTQFSKLYMDFVESASEEGLNNGIENEQEIYEFLSQAGSTRACLVKTEGANEKHFINDGFNFQKTIPKKGTSAMHEALCTGSVECAQKYLNDSSFSESHSDMISYNGRQKALRESAITSYMQTIAQNAQLALNEGRALYNQLKDCEVYAATTAGFDYTDPLWNNRNQKSTYDKKITCYSVGVETQDYPACASMVTAYDAIFAGRIVVDEVQKLDYTNHAMDAQANLAKKVGSDATAALKFQKDDLKKQAQLQNQKAAIEGAALGTLTKFYNDMPDREDLKTKCMDIASADSFANLYQYYSEYSLAILNKLMPYHQRGYIKLVNDDVDTTSSTSNVFNCGGQANLEYEVPHVAFDNDLISLASSNTRSASSLPDAEAVKDNHCAEFIDAGQNSLVMNTEAKDGMKGAMIKAGVDVATYLGKAALLNKQAGKIDTAVKQVESFQPTDVTFESDTPNSLECFNNPEAEGCVIDNDGSLDFYDGTINLGGSGGATISGGSGSDSSNSVSGSNSPTDRSDVAVPIGTPVAKANKGSGDFESRPAGAIGMKKSGGGAGGAGGGGSAGAVAPPGGGGGSKGGGGSSGYSGPRAQKLSYSGGGSSLNYSSGSRRSKRSTKKATNPLSKLFGKKKGKGGVLNFRDTASSKQIRGKGGNLFDMISSRYGKVSEKKRLEVYENVKK